MVHIKSEELCERCAWNVDRCMEKWDEDGKQCEGCRMNRGRTAALCEGACICDEIKDGTPCEYFEEAADAKG